MQSIRFKDELIEQIKEMEAGTKQQQFNAVFLITTETFDGLLRDLLDSFAEQPAKIGKIDQTMWYQWLKDSALRFDFNSSS